MLLNAGACVTYVNRNGRTALMEAVIQKDFNTVEKLLQMPEMNTGSYFGFGTKPINYADHDGNTALILAIKGVQYTYVSGDCHQYGVCENSQKILNAFIENPAVDFDQANHNGQTGTSLLAELLSKMRHW